MSKAHFGYNFVLNLVKKEDFGYRNISTVKVSDAKQWFAKLQKDGMGSLRCGRDAQCLHPCRLRTRCGTDGENFTVSPAPLK